MKPLYYQVRFISFLISLLFCLLSGAASSQEINPKEAPPGPAVVLKEKLPENIAALRQRIPEMMKQADVPGLEIAFIQNEEIIWNESFGSKQLGSPQPVTLNTIFEAGSLSKPVFTYAILKLVNQGVLELDKPLTHYMAADYIADKRINQVTARMVLSHTSGLPLWWPQNEALQIYFKPGERFSYSSEAYVYLQNIVEQITQKPFAELMNKLVFQPLQMTRSSFVWKNSFEDNVALGHNMFAVPQQPWKRTMPNAAASLYTTAADYAKFVLAVINGEGLNTSLNQEMLKPQIQLDPHCIECLNKKPEGLSEELTWGLGWGLEKSGQETSFWHWSDNMLFTAYCSGSAERNSAVVFFTNSSNGLSLRDDIVTTTFGGEHPAFKWIHYDQYNSPAMIFRQVVLKEGTDQGFITYHDLKQEYGNKNDIIPENTLNELGYMLLELNRFDEAVEIFRLNIEEHPDSWNVYDSLAEAYANYGDKSRAINYYNIALKKVNDKPNKERINRIIEKLNR